MDAQVHLGGYPVPRQSHCCWPWCVCGSRATGASLGLGEVVSGKVCLILAFVLSSYERCWSSVARVVERAR